MKKLIGLLFALGFVGCGQSQQSPPFYGVAVDSQFQPYVNSFVAQAQTQGTPVQVQDLVVTMQPELDTDTEMGSCMLYPGIPQNVPPPTININLQFWVQLDQAGREALIYHELGHCILSRVHRPDTNNGEPLSVMNAYSFSDVLFQANNAQYMYELFHQTDLTSALPMIVPSSSGETVVNATTSTNDPGTGEADTNESGVTKTSTKVIFDENNKIVGWKCDHDDS